uniref:CS domain-containing protein n=1 Tax=Echinostoma caproni TaxID=27848 RepID=A0A183AU95_9TREM
LKLQDDEFWNPRLLLDNAQGEPIEIVSHEVEFVEPDFEAYLVEKRRIKGVFHETLELKHFPFDVQDLSVTVTCDRTVEEVVLVPSPTEVSQVDRRGASDSQEWKIFHHVDCQIQLTQWNVTHAHGGAHGGDLELGKAVVELFLLFNISGFGHW